MMLYCCFRPQQTCTPLISKPSKPTTSSQTLVIISHPPQFLESGHDLFAPHGFNHADQLSRSPLGSLVPGPLWFAHTGEPFATTGGYPFHTQPAASSDPSWSPALVWFPPPPPPPRVVAPQVSSVVFSWGKVQTPKCGPEFFFFAVQPPPPFPPFFFSLTIFSISVTLTRRWRYVIYRLASKVSPDLRAR